MFDVPQHNPADQMDTIGVGAVSASGRGVAKFQSRGITCVMCQNHGVRRPICICRSVDFLPPTGRNLNLDLNALQHDMDKRSPSGWPESPTAFMTVETLVLI